MATSDILTCLEDRESEEEDREGSLQQRDYYRNAMDIYSRQCTQIASGCLAV